MHCITAPVRYLSESIYRVKKPSRNEAEVFAELATLVRAPGYVHAIAQICYRDNVVVYVGEVKTSDLQKLHSGERLIRTEIATILGLLVRGPIDFTRPTTITLKGYVDLTDRLMKELHEAMEPPFDAIIAAAKAGARADEIWRGEALREPIFYGSESAYGFQYRDMAAEKYQSDDPWLIDNKGFSISRAQAIAHAMYEILGEKMARAFNAMKESGEAPASWLLSFEQTLDEIASRSGAPILEIQAFLDAFTFGGENVQFQSAGDFNAMNATPLLNTGSGGVLLFQPYSVYESLYESPFYWMMADKAYQATAARHRGEFTERFAARRLASVFGTERVHSNVDLAQSKGVLVGEIDVLVVFGDRLIIVQCKSKKLTLAARRGNDGQLRKDFAAAIQDSYDQAWICANAILVGDCELLDSGGAEITLPHPPKEILIFNVVAEHYPALAFQARQFLTYQATTQVCAPFVMDVFLLDALTEMLDTPLRLLSYAKLRVENIERLALSHELTALGFHLKRNLCIEPEFNLVMLEDAIADDLDLAMMVRRDSVEGPRTPEGILTRFVGTRFEHLISQIDDQPDPAALEVGLFLLTLDEDTCRNIDSGLSAITRQTREDHSLHDFTIGSDSGDDGVTFHCNSSPSEVAMQRLRAHCELRKYRQRAHRWFGLSLGPGANLQFAGVLDCEWEQSDEMDVAAAPLRQAVPIARLAKMSHLFGRDKVGRNASCPCGSGKKFKRCCLGKKG
jgi:SEC-C motif